MSDLDVDLNKTIAAAINSKIEAGVMAALSGDEVLGQYVAAALNQPTTVNGGGYRDKKTTFLHSVVMQVMQDAVKAAVARVIQDEADVIEAEVRKTLRREAGEIAGQFMRNLTEKATASYGVSVELRWPNNY